MDLESFFLFSCVIFYLNSSVPVKFITEQCLGPIAGLLNLLEWYILHLGLLATHQTGEQVTHLDTFQPVQHCATGVTPDTEQIRVFGLLTTTGICELLDGGVVIKTCIALTLKLVVLK